MTTANTGLHQDIIKDDINFVCESLGSVGQVVVYNSAGNVEVKASAHTADKVAGLLLIGVVNRAVPGNLESLPGDFTGTTSFPKNHNANETHISGVVRLLKIGELETDQVNATDNFVPGTGLYLDDAGLLTVSNTFDGPVGHALSTKNADGYVKVYINIT
jgi:hypothetical protein